MNSLFNRPRSKPTLGMVALVLLMSLTSGCYDNSRWANEAFWRSAGVDEVLAEMDQGMDVKDRDDLWVEYLDWVHHVLGIIGISIEGRTPLHWAAGYSNDPDVIRLLLHRGADVHAEAALQEGCSTHGVFVGGPPDISFRVTPLHYSATHNENPSVAKLLLDSGADVHAKSKYDDVTPLHCAAAHNENPSVVSLLMDRGADINAESREGTPLIHAAGQNENPSVIALLLDRDADIDEGLLYAATSNENPTVILFLLDRGADAYLNARNSYFGDTPLHEAATYNKNPAAVALLLDRGADADIYVRDRYGETPLHKAAKFNKNPSVVALLLDRGADADLDARDSDGETPLHEATERNGNPSVIALLLDRGADINVRNYDGKTACEIAKERDEFDGVEILRRLCQEK